MSRNKQSGPFCAYYPADCDPSASDSGYVGNPVKRQMRCLVGRGKGPSGISWYGACSYLVVSQRFSLGRCVHDKPSLTRSGSGSSAHSGRWSL